MGAGKEEAGDGTVSTEPMEAIGEDSGMEEDDEDSAQRLFIGWMQVRCERSRTPAFHQTTISSGVKGHWGTHVFHILHRNRLALRSNPALLDRGGAWCHLED